MNTNQKILKEEINRFKKIVNYGILNENATDDIIKRIIRNTVDDLMKTAIKSSIKDQISALISRVGKQPAARELNIKIMDELLKPANVNNLTTKVAAGLGKTVDKLDDSTKNSIKTQLVKTVQSTEYIDDIIKQMDDVVSGVKNTTNTASKTTSTALTVGTEQLDDSAKKTANNLVFQYADDVARVKQLLPASGKNIAVNNRRFFVDFFGRAKLITDVGGRKILTKRNLLIAAAIVGISWLTLKSDLEAEGVQVESDTVDTTSCLGALKDSGHHPGRKYYVYEPVGGFVYYYYDSGAFYFVNEILKQQYPKGSNNYLKFYCNDKTIVPTEEIVGIDGKPLGTTTPKVGDESPVTGGNTYTGGSGWRSLGPTYDKEILQALGNNEDRRLNDEDIKNIYNKLKTAGKVN